MAQVTTKSSIEALCQLHRYAVDADKRYQFRQELAKRFEQVAIRYAVEAPDSASICNLYIGQESLFTQDARTELIRSLSFIRQILDKLKKRPSALTNRPAKPINFSDQDIVKTYFAAAIRARRLPFKKSSSIPT